MLFFLPLNKELALLPVVCGFYLKYLGRNVQPVSLTDFLKNPYQYLCDNRPMTFAVELHLFGKGWDRSQHITLAFTGRKYSVADAKRFAGVVSKFVKRGPPKRVELLGFHFLGNQMLSLVVAFPKVWHKFASELYFENGVPEGNAEVQRKFGMPTYHVTMPFFLKGKFKFMEDDLKQAGEKSDDCLKNEKLFYEWLKVVVETFPKYHPSQWANLSTLPDMKADKTAAFRENEALVCVSEYLQKV